MFLKMNAVMRGQAPRFDREPLAVNVEQWRALCAGNLYKNTLHAITAAIGKLSRLTRVCTLYRGPGGVTPRSFWEEDTYGCTGGVEMALMSCSKDKEEALKYVRRSKSKLLFEIQQGMTARGAEIAWLSQFPAEDEVTFAPLCALEVQGTRVEGRVMVVEIRPGVARCSLQEMSVDQKRAEEREREAAKRASLQRELAKGRWTGCMSRVKLALIKLENARAKEALALEARRQGMLSRQHRTQKKLIEEEAIEQREVLLARQREAHEEVLQAERELVRQREEVLKADADAETLRLVEQQTRGFKTSKERLAARLLLDAMRAHLLRRRLRAAEQGLDDMQVRVDRADQEATLRTAKSYLHRMKATKDLLVMRHHAGDVQEQMAAREQELVEQVALQQVELDAWAKKEKSMEKKMRKEITKEIEERIKEGYEGKIKSMREELLCKMDEINDLKRGKK